MERANISYKIGGFELTQFVPSWDGLNGSESFGVKSGVDFSYNFEQYTIKSVLNVEFYSKEILALKIQLCTFVTISEETAKALENDGKIVIPAGFLAQCASFGHGALRGIMYLKTANTPLEGIIMPPFEYGKLFKKSISFDIPKK
jgi:hypothetical protein